MHSHQDKAAPLQEEGSNRDEPLQRADNGHRFIIKAYLQRVQTSILGPAGSWGGGALKARISADTSCCCTSKMQINGSFMTSTPQSFLMNSITSKLVPVGASASCLHADDGELAQHLDGRALR